MTQHERVEVNHKKLSNFVGLTSMVATSQSEVGVRCFSNADHLVGQTLSVVADQSEADAFNAHWWDIHTALSPTNQMPRRLRVRHQSWWDIDPSFY